jgi:hypothetical protein
MAFRYSAAAPARVLIELVQALARLAVSACLMTMVYGAVRVGPNNPTQHRRLERHDEASRRSGDAGRLANAAFDLRALPVRYRLAQDVRLYRVEAAEERAEGGEATCLVLAPHWRRGHYRMQAYGPGLSQRRRIAVPAVLVNAHLFLGPKQGAAATYRS